VDDADARLHHLRTADAQIEPVDLTHETAGTLRQYIPVNQVHSLQ
jgi:hypothetical protein